MRRSIWVGLVSVALVLFLAVACTWRLHTRTPPVAEKQEAPGFWLRDTEDKIVTLDDLLVKGPAVVVFYRGFW